MNNNNNKPLTNVNLSLVKNDSKNFGLDFFSTPKNTDFLDHEFNPINNNHNLLFENFNYEWMWIVPNFNTCTLKQQQNINILKLF